MGNIVEWVDNISAWKLIWSENISLSYGNALVPNFLLYANHNIALFICGFAKGRREYGTCEQFTKN